MVALYPGRVNRAVIWVWPGNRKDTMAPKLNVTFACSPALASEMKS